MSSFFAFLYDDEAPGPLASLGDAVKSAAKKVKAVAAEAATSETGQNVKKSVGVGLTIGAGVGTAIFLIASASNIADKLFKPR